MSDTKFIKVTGRLIKGLTQKEWTQPMKDWAKQNYGLTSQSSKQIQPKLVEYFNDPKNKGNYNKGALALLNKAIKDTGSTIHLDTPREGGKPYEEEKKEEEKQEQQKKKKKDIESDTESMSIGGSSKKSSQISSSQISGNKSGVDLTEYSYKSKSSLKETQKAFDNILSSLKNVDQDDVVSEQIQSIFQDNKELNIKKEDQEKLKNEIMSNIYPHLKKIQNTKEQINIDQKELVYLSKKQGVKLDDLIDEMAKIHTDSQKLVKFKEEYKEIQQKIDDDLKEKQEKAKRSEVQQGIDLPTQLIHKQSKQQFNQQNQVQKMVTAKKNNPLQKIDVRTGLKYTELF